MINHNLDAAPNVAYIGAKQYQKGLKQGDGQWVYTTYPEQLTGTFTVYLYVNLYWGMLYSVYCLVLLHIIYLQFIYTISGYNLQVTAGFTFMNNSSNKCVQAVITENSVVASCSITGT